MATAVAPHPGIEVRSRARMLVSATVVSGLGDQITTVAIAVLAVVSLHASAFAVALLVACNRLPYPLIGLPVGVLADRVSRRRLLISSDLLRAALLAFIPAAIALHHLSVPLLAIVAAAVGTCSVVFDVAKLAWVPSIVGTGQVGRAQSQLQVAQGITQVVGPGLAGVALVLVGAGPSILADCASFLISACLVAAQTERATVLVADQSVLGDMIAGLRYVFGSVLLRGVLATTSLSAFAYGAEALFSVVALRYLGLSASGYGAMLSTVGVGWLLGSAFANPIGRRFGLLRTMSVARLAEGLSLAGMLILLVVRSPYLGALLLLVTALADAVGTLCGVTIRQTETPEALRGRVNAIFRTLFWGMIPLGNLMLGALALALGPLGAIGVAGVVAAIAGLLMLRLPIND